MCIKSATHARHPATCLNVHYAQVAECVCHTSMHTRSSGLSLNLADGTLLLYPCPFLTHVPPIALRVELCTCVVRLLFAPPIVLHVVLCPQDDFDLSPEDEQSVDVKDRPEVQVCMSQCNR